MNIWLGEELNSLHKRPQEMPTFILNAGTETAPLAISSVWHLLAREQSGIRAEKTQDNEAWNEPVRNEEGQEVRMKSLSHKNYSTHQWVWSYFYGNELIMVKSFSKPWLIHEVVSNVDNHFMNHWQTQKPNTGTYDCFLSWWAFLPWCGVSLSQEPGVQTRKALFTCQSLLL